MKFNESFQFQLKLGLWVDLTNTKRFYDRREVELRDCQYAKLQCRGHGETPSADQTRAFIDIVDTFVAENPMQIVGVHCTHGFNRTGFLIVSYMVEKMDCSVEAALMAFAAARPPGIYKADYIKELFRRYDEEDDAPPAPPLPDWCYGQFDYISIYSLEYIFELVNCCFNVEEEEEDWQADHSEESASSSLGKRKADDKGDNGETNDNDDVNSNGGTSSSDGPKKKRRKEFLNLNATFMAGVPGVTLITDQVSSYLLNIRQL